MTRLLLDTDIFCKLGVADLLDDTLSILGLKYSDCSRLPALPHMLRRGRLVRQSWRWPKRASPNYQSRMRGVQ